MSKIVSRCPICRNDLRIGLVSGVIECGVCGYELKVDGRVIDQINDMVEHIKAQAVWSGEVIPCRACQSYLIPLEHLSKLAGENVSTVMENGCYLSYNVYRVKCKSCGYENTIGKALKIEVN